MMKCIVKFYDLAQKAIKESPSDKKLSWDVVKSQLADSIHEMVQMKFLVRM